MPVLLFLIDDSNIGFWEREEKNTWAEHLDRLKNSGAKIREIHRATTGVADSVREAKENDAEFTGWLITDQKLFGAEFDGADLATQLLKSKIVERAVVFSEIAQLRPEQYGLPMIAESRIRSRDAIVNLFSFLETGQYPKIEDFFRFAAKIENTMAFFRDNVQKFEGEMSGELLLRSATGYGVWEGDPKDGRFLLDAWLVSLGVDVPQLFSLDSARLFSEDVRGDVLQYLGGRQNKSASAKWERVLYCLHPWKCLEMSTALPSGSGGRQGGAFRLLVEIAKCGGRAEVIPESLSEEGDLAPRERAWLREHRRRLRSRIEEVLKAGDSSLRRCVQQCIDELDDVCSIITMAAETRNQR